MKKYQIAITLPTDVRDFYEQEAGKYHTRLSTYLRKSLITFARVLKSGRSVPILDHAGSVLPERLAPQVPEANEAFVLTDDDDPAAAVHPTKPAPALDEAPVIQPDSSQPEIMTPNPSGNFPSEVATPPVGVDGRPRPLDAFDDGYEPPEAPIVRPRPDPNAPKRWKYRPPS